jgi:hypothetical protein
MAPIRLSGSVAGSTALAATAAGAVREFRNDVAPLNQLPEDRSPQIYAAAQHASTKSVLGRMLVAVDLMTAPGSRLLALDRPKPP